MDLVHLLASIVIAAIAAVPPTVAALAAWRRTEVDIDLTKRCREDVNGKLELLIEEVRHRAYLEGYLAGWRSIAEATKKEGPSEAPPSPPGPRE